jgi:hypothetical protein
MAIKEIVFDLNGTLYTLEDDGIYSWNQDRTEKTLLAANSSFSSMVVGDGGNLYVLGTTRETVLSINPGTKEVQVYAPQVKLPPPPPPDQNYVRYMRFDEGVYTPPFTNHPMGGIYSTKANQGDLTFKVDMGHISKPFVIWAFHLSPDAGRDSFWVSVNGGIQDVFDTAENKWSTNWQWSVVNGRGDTGRPENMNPRQFTLKQGQNSIEFRGREAGCRILGICLTNDSGFIPDNKAFQLPEKVLNAPTGLETVSSVAGEAELNWVDTNSKEAKHEVESKMTTSEDNFYKIHTTDVGSTYYKDRGLTEGERYSYRIRALSNKGAVSPYSNLSIVTIKEKTQPPPSITGVFVALDGSRSGKGTKDSPLDLKSLLAGEHRIDAGEKVLLTSGNYRIPRSVSEARERVSLKGGTKDSPITIMPYMDDLVTIDGGFSIDGPENLIFRGLFIYVSENRKVGDSSRPLGGFNIQGSRNIQIVNCFIKNTGQAIEHWSESIGGGVYGCIISSTGSSRHGREYAGHAIYTQSRGEEVKTIYGNIITDGWDYSLHGYSEQGTVYNYMIGSNTVYQNRSQCLMGGLKPQKNITVKDNYIYDDTLRIGYQWTQGRNSGAVITNNVILRGDLDVIKYDNTVVKDNIIADQDRPSGLSQYWVQNTHDSRRCNITVFNWNRSESFSINNPFLRGGGKVILQNPLTMERIWEGVPSSEGIKISTAKEFHAFIASKEFV